MHIQWRLRYRSPLSPTKGVYDVLVGIQPGPPGETPDQQAKRARVVADHYLNTKVAHPSTKFIFLEPAVVMTDTEMQADLHPADTTADDLDEMTGSDRPQTSTVIPRKAVEKARELDKGIAEPGDGVDAPPIARGRAKAETARPRVGQ